jgi:hypothetical protein
MADVLFVAITIGFFALCVAYIGACARIIGHEAPADSDETAELEEAIR